MPEISLCLHRPRLHLGNHEASAALTCCQPPICLSIETQLPSDNDRKSLINKQTGSLWIPFNCEIFRFLSGLLAVFKECYYIVLQKLEMRKLGGNALYKV